MKLLLWPTVFLLAAVTLISGSVVKSPSNGNFELLILHNNDMHARFEQTSQMSGACTIADREAGKCYGGFPRVAYVVKEARKAAASGEGPPVLYLNAGDTYTGTAWFTIYKWKIAAEFLNALQPDAVSLGNDEFAKDSTELLPFLKNLKTNIIATNIILNTEENQELQKSVIFDIKGTKVGMVGYLTPEISMLDSAGAVEYIDEVIALKEEVNKLKEQNVSIIIALGHADIDKVIEIATEVDGIDLVINGHKNFYYWNGTSINNQLTDTEIEIKITQKSGKIVPILQSYSYNKNLGKIIAKYDNDGEIIEYQAQQIPLDSSIPQDLEALEVIRSNTAEIYREGQEIVGYTAVVLDGDTCKLEECNFGNLLTDSVTYYYAVRFQGERWTNAPIAIIHSDAITTSIAPENRPAAITRTNLLSALETGSNLVTVTMNGTVLLQVLEYSVANYSYTNPSGQFLQYSGIRVTYDLAKEPGSRVIRAFVRCWSCYIPQFYTIDDWREYTILMPSSLANGDEGYSMLVGLPRQNLDYDVATCIEAYIAQRSPVYPEVSGRIILLNTEAVPDSATALSSTLTLLLFIITFIIG
ncbi:unnamed protein product [Parnassius apollo]|uniref:5'-nucleotidase n=1 Tax=Parnassius apollo TaxID=110799 RepID=A0A8S3XR27_PARAO|nr:unnamed protein product [Parnassius apollo]